jgi:hypothetical protein
MRLYYFFTFVFLFVACTTANGQAHYMQGTTEVAKEFEIDSQGGSFTVKNTNTPVDGVSIEVPPGALKKRVVMSIGYNKGHLNLSAGEASGVVLVLRVSNNINSFEKPFKIIAHFDPSIKPMSIIGYAIDEKGSLRPIDTISKLKAQGVVAFYTFRPLMFTWVYVHNVSL